MGRFDKNTPKIGRPREYIRSVENPELLSKTLYDVWFLFDGRKVRRVKVSVTTDPSFWEGSVAWNKLNDLVKEKFKGNLSRANRAKLQITDRPNENVVFELRWKP